MNLLVSDANTSQGANSWGWLRLTLITYNGKQVLVQTSNHGQVFQQLPNGGFKFEDITKVGPGAYEVVKLSNGQGVWETGFTRVYAELP